MGLTTKATLRIGATVLGCLALATPAHAALNDTALVSQGALGAPALGYSGEPSISGDGRVVAFRSAADNMLDNDNDTYTNVYARELVTGTTTLVSQPTGQGGGAANDKNSGDSGAAISDNGQFVAFESAASNLTADNNATYVDVFVRNLDTGTTMLASQPTGTGGGADNNGSSLSAVISADGRYVAFNSLADNLSGTDNDAVQNVFVRDTLTNVTTLVSQPTGGGANLNDGSSYVGGISADGRYVLFGSSSDNMSDADNDSFESVHVRDVQESTTTLVSQPTGNSGCAACAADSYAQSLSPDGRYAAFESASGNLSGNDGNSVDDVFVRDLQAGTTTLVSLPTGAADASANNGNSFDPDISTGGRYVSFESHSDNLSEIDNDAVKSVFVHDLQTGVTTLASQPTGTAGAATSNGDSSWSSISNDGRYVAFASLSDTLSAADADGTTDVFVRDYLGGPDPQPPGSQPQPQPQPQPAAPSPDSPPTLSGVSLTNRRFAANRNCGARRTPGAPRWCTRLRLTLSEQATITVTVDRALKGRRVGSRCVAPTPRNEDRPRCTRRRRAGRVTARGTNGRNVITLRGIVRGRRLAPGRYRLTIRARDSAGQRSSPVVLTVTVVKPPR
jgi:hypothetical protein